MNNLVLVLFSLLILFLNQSKAEDIKPASSKDKFDSSLNQSEVSKPVKSSDEFDSTKKTDKASRQITLGQILFLWTFSGLIILLVCYIVSRKSE